MNQISLEVRIISDNESLLIDGIEFTNAILIKLMIDGVLSNKLKHMEVSLVVHSELLRSLSGSGRYLIFTAASGIADDGGWDGVDVEIDENLVVWDFEVENIKHHFEFDFFQYEKELQELEKSVVALSSKFDLEPTEIFFPEEWETIA